MNKVGEETLEDRRGALSLKFAKKCTVHPKLKHYFMKKQINKTKSMVPAPEIYIEPMTHSARGARNPIVYLIRLLNGDMITK